MEIMKVCISKIVCEEKCGGGGGVEWARVGGGVGGESLLKKDTPTKTQQTKGQWNGGGKTERAETASVEE